MIWITIMIPAGILLIADAMGWIDLTTRPLPRVMKWIAAAVVAWAMPLVFQGWLRLQIDEKHLELWKLLILGVLGVALVTSLIKWIWSAYRPAPEGFRRCPQCRKPVMKVMLECPHCKRPV